MDSPIVELVFRRQPSAVIPEHRPLYKISQLALILNVSSRAGRSKVSRLHLLNWALKKRSRQLLLERAAESGTLRIQAWGFDPILAFAIRFALADGIVADTSTGYELTEKGRSFAMAILKDPTLLASDKVFLERIGKGITETMVDAVANDWDIR
ncbi:MAG: hypothetical protein SF172_03380 [Burkholderiales bacterium]|nr:hypothetical protein [Burkholderiales bacterium]